MHLNRRATLATEATPDYSANDLCGGKLQFTMRTAGGGGRLVRWAMKSLVSFSGIASKAYLFDSDPDTAGADGGATTFTENGAWTLAAADRTRLIDVIDIADTDWVDYSARAGVYMVEKALDVPFSFAAGGRSIWAAFIVGATLNLGSTTDIEAMVGAEVD